MKIGVSSMFLDKDVKDKLKSIRKKLDDNKKDAIALDKEYSDLIEKVFTDRYIVKRYKCK